MKKISLILLTLPTLAFSFSIVPERVVTRPLLLYSGRELSTGEVSVPVTTWTKAGELIQFGATAVLPKATYDAYIAQANAVLAMIPRASFGASKNRQGTAFHIGHNLVLTNNHVLDETYYNTTDCADFQLRDRAKDNFECKRVHFCNPTQDICLIEMKPITKRKKDCFLCAGEKYEVTLAAGAALKLKSQYQVPPEEWHNEILTAIGNTMGWGIHYSQGSSVVIYKDRTYFWAPISNGNSGGPLLNKEGLVVGLVKLQSEEIVSKDPRKSYNVALPVEQVISLVREGLRDNPEILEKFNQAVVE